jgi:uncharacterized protein YhbP (UPF0306 family)
MVADLDLAGRVSELLEGCSTMTLATSGPEGLWAADVFFAARGTAELFFISSPNSRHAGNLLAAPRAAATVHAEIGSDWRAIRGLQMEGEVALVGDEGIEQAQAAYFAKFPFAARLLRPDSDVAAKTAGTHFFVLRVQRLYLVDNSLGFGNRQEIDVERAH